MTCIGYFYQRPGEGGASDSYPGLYGRLHELANAKRHLEHYLTDRPWMTAPSRSDDAPFRMIRTPTEVTKYVVRRCDGARSAPWRASRAVEQGAVTLTVGSVPSLLNYATFIGC